MHMRGEDTQAALREWVKAEIREGPRQAYDLGKFFFSVSAATIGAIVAIEKMNTGPLLDAPMIVCLLALGVSVFVALDLARPRIFTIGGDTDLHQEYERQIGFASKHIWSWFFLWAVGVGSGAAAISG